jgi:hypothetical protein
VDARFARQRMLLTAPIWRTKEEQMADAYILAIALAKWSFQICATDRAGSVLYDRTMSRAKLDTSKNSGF